MIAHPRVRKRCYALVQERGVSIIIPVQVVALLEEQRATVREKLTKHHKIDHEGVRLEHLFATVQEARAYLEGGGESNE